MRFEHLPLRALAFACAVMASIGLRGATVSLAWNPSPDTRTTGYNVWWAAYLHPYTVTNVGLETACSLTGLDPSQTYYFMICSVDSNGDLGPFGNQVVYTVPSPPVLSDLAPVADFTPIGVILTPGAATVVAPDANIGFFVSASGESLKYTWKCNGIPLNAPSSSPLWLWNVQPSQAGVYTVTVSNPFGSVTSAPITVTVTPPLATTFNGLFYETNQAGAPDIRIESAGMLANFVVETNGVFSAKLCLDNAGYVFAGAFDPYGNSETILSRAIFGQTYLDVRLHLDPTLAAGGLSGSVSNMSPTEPWVASLTADAASTTNALAGVVEANVLSLSGEDLSGQIFLANLLGEIYISGLFTDGALFSENVPISAADRVPIYASLYGGMGLFEGWFSLSQTLPGGTFTWIQEPGVPGSIYPGGFTNVAWAALSR